MTVKGQVNAGHLAPCYEDAIRQVLRELQEEVRKSIFVRPRSLTRHMAARVIQIVESKPSDAKGKQKHSIDESDRRLLDLIRNRTLVFRKDYASRYHSREHAGQALEVEPEANTPGSSETAVAGQATADSSGPTPGASPVHYSGGGGKAAATMHSDPPVSTNSSSSSAVGPDVASNPGPVIDQHEMHSTHSGFAGGTGSLYQEQLQHERQVWETLLRWNHAGSIAQLDWYTQTNNFNEWHLTSKQGNEDECTTWTSHRALCAEGPVSDSTPAPAPTAPPEPR